jgi:pimeloyl-ACP methyl ester carboxylesterase
MLALADTLGPGRVFLGGVSMGCATALHAAVAAPERVAGLVLVAPPTAWATRPRQARFYRFASSLVGWFGLAPFRLLARIPAPGSGSPVAALQSELVDQLARADARAVAATLRGAAESDLPAPALLRSVRAPALILAWRKDPVHPVSTATRLRELLPQADLSVAGTLQEIRGWPERVARFLRENQAEARR